MRSYQIPISFEDIRNELLRRHAERPLSVSFNRLEWLNVDDLMSTWHLKADVQCGKTIMSAIGTKSRFDEVVLFHESDGAIMQHEVRTGCIEVVK